MLCLNIVWFDNNITANPLTSPQFYMKLNFRSALLWFQTILYQFLWFHVPSALQFQDISWVHLPYQWLKDWFGKNALWYKTFVIKYEISKFWLLEKHLSFSECFILFTERPFFLNWFNIHDVTPAPHLFSSIF